MKLIATDLPGCLVFEPRIFEDARGTFYETFNLDRLGEHGLAVEFDDLIRDESTHRDEIQMILKRWDTG